MRDRRVFTGHIAGVGTTSGVRMVIGMWAESPFGAFADVMVEASDGARSLLAPTEQVAEFVSTTYEFDHVAIGPVTAEHTPGGFTVTAPGLAMTGCLGGPAQFDWLLRLVPPPLARTPLWLRAIDPVASRLVEGVHTAGSAGHGRREYYGVRRTRRIVAIGGDFGGVRLGGLARLDPPVRFGFSSAPATPQMVSVTTTIDLP